MRGASAESVAELSGRLGSGSPTHADLARLGEELHEVAQVLGSEAALRRFATDTAIEADARSGLAAAVFGDRLDQRTVALLGEAFGLRWTSAHDLADALEELAVTAIARSTGARADALGDELFTVARTVEQAPDLRSALADPSRSVEDRRSLVGGLLSGKVLAATETLVSWAIGSDRGPFGVAISQYERIVAASADEVVAVVRTARPLAAGDVDRLAAALGKQYSTQVHLQVVEDPSLIGGLRVEIGDDVIDGSVASRLDEARRKLAG